MQHKGLKNAFLTFIKLFQVLNRCGKFLEYKTVFKKRIKNVLLAMFSV